MAYLQHPMLLHLLEQIEFDTETGCWFGPSGTYYHGRSLWFLWFGEKDEGYTPAILCPARFIDGDECNCVNPEHVRKQLAFVRFAERVAA